MKNTLFILFYLLVSKAIFGEFVTILNKDNTPYNVFVKAGTGVKVLPYNISNDRFGLQLFLESNIIIKDRFLVSIYGSSLGGPILEEEEPYLSYYSTSNLSFRGGGEFFFYNLVSDNLININIDNKVLVDYGLINKVEITYLKDIKYRDFTSFGIRTGYGTDPFSNDIYVGLVFYNRCRLKLDTKEYGKMNIFKLPFSYKIATDFLYNYEYSEYYKFYKENKDDELVKYGWRVLAEIDLLYMTFGLELIQKDSFGGSFTAGASIPFIINMLN